VSGHSSSASAGAEAWLADLEIGDELASRLIEREFRPLTPIALRRIGEGWDNVAFAVNGRYVFRFPRRVVSAKLIEREARVLPLIADRLPLPIPVPSFIGRPSDEYPWPFAGYRKLKGFPLSAVRPEDDQYEVLAQELASFVRALHSIDCKPLFAAGLSDDEIGRFDYARTIDKLGVRLGELKSDGVVPDASAILRFVGDLQPIAARLESRALVHGDLYASHILVDQRFQPTGIIDWGDVHFGEPAIDLTVAYAVIPPSLRERFFETYGGVDETARRLARYRAIYSSVLLAHYGDRTGDANLVYAGLRGLRLAQT
jgi:aminoglycoside phosphotransferase (APT) family kinase protein